MIKKSFSSVNLERRELPGSITNDLGTAIQLVLSCPNYRLFRIATIGAWLTPPLLLKQIAFFYDRSGRPVGYVTWAYIAPDVESKLVSDSRYLLHLSEWNEGDQLWIMDFVAPQGMVREIVRFMRTAMFQEHPGAKYLRRNASGDVRKVCSWKNITATNSRSMDAD